MKKTIYIILTLLSFSHLFAQSELERKHQFATSYLQNGQIEDAARLFTEIFNQEPSNPNYFKGLVESYKFLNRYEELIPFTESFMNNSKDPSLGILLGELYWRKGESEKAKRIWDETLNNSRNVGFIYNALVDTQMSLKLFSEAASTIMLGRQNTGENDLLNEELIKIYIATGDYKNCSVEIINDLLRNRSLPTAQGRIYALMYDQNAIDFLNSFLLEQARKMDKNILIQELLAWFFSTTGNNDDALDIYIRIDRLTNSEGREILKFANTANKDKSYDIALKAYEIIIDKDQYQKYQRNALLGYAKTLENKFSDGLEMTDERAKQIIKRYQDFISNNRENSVSGEAWFRIGQIQVNHFKDFKKGLFSFEKAIDFDKGGALTANSAIEIANIYLIENDIDKAESSIISSIDLIRKNFRDEIASLKFMKARIEFYKGNIDETNKILTSLAKQFEYKTANDAIQLSLLLQVNKDHKDALIQYSKADLFKLQSKFNESIEYFEKIKELAPQSNIAQISILEIASINFDNKIFEKSIEELEEFKFNYAASSLIDKALMLLGKSYKEMGKNSEAIQVFSQLLVDHPNSIYVNDARQKIRELRGEI